MGNEDELGTWKEPSAEVVDRLAHWAVFAADRAVLDADAMPSSVPRPDGSPQPLTAAELTAVAVRAALRMLLANGLIEALLPPETADVWVVLDPPPLMAGREDDGSEGDDAG